MSTCWTINLSQRHLSLQLFASRPSSNQNFSAVPLLRLLPTSLVIIVISSLLHAHILSSFSSVQSLSRVQLFVTLCTVARQAPLSMGPSRQEYWSGLPFPSRMSESEVAQLCLTSSDPMDCSLPSSSVHEIF